MLEAKPCCCAMTFKSTTEKDVEESCCSDLYCLQLVFEFKNMIPH